MREGDDSVKVRYLNGGFKRYSRPNLGKLVDRDTVDDGSRVFESLTEKEIKSAFAEADANVRSPARQLASASLCRGRHVLAPSLSASDHSRASVPACAARIHARTLAMRLRVFAPPGSLRATCGTRAHPLVHTRCAPPLPLLACWVTGVAARRRTA